MNLRVGPALARVALASLGLLAAPGFRSPVFTQTQGATARSFSVVASRYTFAPLRLEVFQDDVVRIEFSTSDIAHSMPIDDYRVAKRVGPGQTITFEFRAERPGTFPFYCDLKAEDGCREMRGELIVRPRQ